jgi:hypothetical protein
MSFTFQEDSVETPSKTPISFESYRREDLNDILGLPLSRSVPDIFAVEVFTFGGTKNLDKNC